MPEVVRTRIEFPGRNKKNQVDWDALVDGRVYRLRPGADFDSKPHSIQSAAHQAAKRRGKLCRTKVEDGSVFIQFYSVEDAQ